MNSEDWASLLDINRLTELLAQQPPWWVYVVAALIPFSLMFVAREFLCWFFKINRRNRSLLRIEGLLEQQLAQTAPEKNGPTKRDDPLDVRLP